MAEAINKNIYVDSYLDWYRSNVTVKELEKAEQIITPYVNCINDRISIYVELLDGKEIRLSDDGETLDTLDMMGIDLKTKTRQNIISQTLRNFGVLRHHDIIYVKARDISDFPQKKNNLLQAILSLNDLLFTSRTRVQDLFKEEVLDFFFQNDFGGNVGSYFMGSSGILHRMDYSIGATASRPNRLIRLQRKLDYQTVTDLSFIKTDLEQETNLSRYGAQYTIVTSSIPKSTSKPAMAAKSSNIEIIDYHDKSQLLTLK